MAAHPLDPLSPTEYQKTAAVLRRDQDVSNAWRFASINQDNPLGLAMSTQNTIIESESRSARDFKWESQRTWKVINPDVEPPRQQNRVQAGARAAIPSLMDPSSPIYQRAPVIDHSLWVTAYDDSERWPPGDYPPLAPSLTRTWYVLGCSPAPVKI
jgi:Cu2+-containing amine oxidase